MDLRQQIDTNTIIVEDLNTSVISMKRSIRQKLSKGTTGLTQTIEKNGLN